MDMEHGIGAAFVVAAVALVAAIGFSVSTLPSAGSLVLQAGTVFRSPAAFNFTLDTGTGRLVGAWRSDSPVRSILNYANNPGGGPTGSIGGKTDFSEAGQFNVSLVQGSYLLWFAGNATVTVTETIEIASG